MTPSRYSFYATLLDSFQNFLDTDSLWQKYYGSSETPAFSPDEWADKQFIEIINRINRVPFTNDAVVRGTALNDLIDMRLDRLTENARHIIITDNNNETTTIADKLHNEEGGETIANAQTFRSDIINAFSDYYAGAVKQYFTIGTIDTRYGNVDLYGYIDYLLPFSIHDLKTARRYSAGTFKTHWQHLVYPYALMRQGISIDRFEYNITNFKDMFTEVYIFNPQRDIPRLRNICEQFIEFLENNKKYITDRKVFNNRFI